MLVVSSILIAEVMLTIVGIAEARQYKVDSFNDRTARPIPAAEKRWGFVL